MDRLAALLRAVNVGGRKLAVADLRRLHDGREDRLRPGCLYTWFQEGAGKSKLAGAVIERRLKVRGTARNWNTVGKLIVALEG